MILAQTQPSGMTGWTVAEWTAFLAVVTTLIGAVTTSVIAVINAARAKADASVAQKQAEHATTSATTANAVAAEAKGMSVVNTDRVSNIGDQVAAMGLAMKPPNGGHEMPRTPEGPPRIQT